MAAELPNDNHALARGGLPREQLPEFPFQAAAGVGFPSRMDQTQLLDWDGEREPEGPLEGTGGVGESPKPVGRLHLLSSKYGPEKDFWIYPGKNVIGRLESCQICLPASSVSKAHAVIDVPSPDGPHLLYDQGSMNRTRCQRMVLIPQVRYSLQDGNMLLFGDMGCQYFTLGPERVPESPDDSWEVPPTQPGTDAKGLAIEETPAPRRKMGFGGLLVQDSDREEEGEEVVNGAGKAMQLSADNGCDSSTKHGARGHSSLASSMFSSPSATVVPESDEESGEVSEVGPSCPSLCLRYESDEAEPCSLANGAVTPSNQERHPIQPGSTEAKTLPDSRGQLVVKGLDAPTDPSLRDFHLDSDTDVEDEEGTGTASERPAAKDDFALELGSDTDADEPLVVNPDMGSSDDRQSAKDVESDTDIEDSVENLSVLGLKAQRVTKNGDSDTDAEGTVDNPDVASAESQESGLQCEASCKGEERAGGNSEGHQPHEGADSDMHVEAGENPDICLKTQLPPKNENDDTDVEEPPLGAEGALKAGEASGDSDTDVEVAGQEPEKSVGAHPHSPPPMRNKDKDADVEKIKEISLQDNRDQAEGVTEIKNTCVQPPKDYGPAGEQSVDSDRREPVANTEVVEKPTSVPEKQHLLAISVDSDTDEEEAVENPNESPAENHKATSNGPREGNRGSGFVDQEVGPREDGDSDTDVEVTAPSPKTLMAHDSDTDVEEMTLALPGKLVEGQGSQLDPARALVDGEETASSATKQSVFCDAYKEEENTDAEGNMPHSGDESNTDDEGDSDLAVQATQCYLPTATSSPKVEKANDTSDSSCTVEEEATQAFVFQTSLKAAESQPGKGYGPSWTEDDPDVYMLAATQPFFKEAPAISEEPTQAFIVEEEDAELVHRHPLEGEDLSELATQPAVPISASRGEQEAGGLLEDATKPRSLEKSHPEPRSQPTGAAGVEELCKGKEIQPVHSVQVLPLALPEVPEEQASGASPEGEVATEPSRPQGGAGCIEGGAQEKHSEPAGEARDAEQLPKHATDKPSKPVAFVSERRRSLRSSSATSPSPLPERRSSRRGRGRVGSMDTNGSGEPVAPPTRRRGLRQLSSPTQCTGRPERRAEEPKAEEASRRKTPSKGEPAVAVGQGRPRRSQRRSYSRKKQEETGRAATSPGTKKLTRPRKRRATAAEAAGEQQPERCRTRSSRHSGSTSEMTPSPEDSRKGTQVGQEPAQSTPSAGRRSQRQSAGNKPAGTTRNRSQSSASPVAAPKVLFTGVIDEEGERVVTELGGSLAQSVFDCTHLVTDRVRRTVKFLCALARGIPIVTLDWLEKSKRHSFFLPPTSFLVCDPEQEKNFQFNLAQSLQKARQEGGLLQGYELHVTPNVKPEPEHMRDIIKCSGGTFLTRMPRTYKDKRVIISCPEDLPRCKPAQDARVPIANSEFILTGILQQKADLDAYLIDGEGAASLASRAASTTRSSKRRAAALTTPTPPSTAKRRR